MTMLRKLMQALGPKPPKSAPLPDPDAELALGALLVRVAMSDENYQFVEISLIDKILARVYHHSPLEAAKIRAICEKLHAAAPDTDTFAALIRETTSHEERLEAIEAIWTVVLADGREYETEIQMVEDIRMALGLSHAESEAAHDRAKAE